MTFYTDSTPPTAYSGSLTTAIAGINAGDTPRVSYALYEDATTWSAWVEWAKVNAYVVETDGHIMDYNKYTSRALQMVGYWPTMQANTAAADATDNATKSFMCIMSASDGGVCMEAIIGASTNEVNTWRIPASTKDAVFIDAATITYGGTPGELTTDWDFTTKTGDVLNLIAETPSSPAEFKAFGVANCSLTTIKMDCINWVGKDGSDYEDPLLGRHSWTTGDSVTFTWFDGRAYVDSSVAEADRVSVWSNSPDAWDVTHKYK